MWENQVFRRSRKSGRVVRGLMFVRQSLQRVELDTRKFVMPIALGERQLEAFFTQDVPHHRVMGAVRIGEGKRHLADFPLEGRLRVADFTAHAVGRAACENGMLLAV